MATNKQINANKKNALLSKGPKTDLGKLNSSKNSLKHGLTAKQLVIGENLKEFEQYRDQMIEALKPVGILQEQLVFKIIDVALYEAPLLTSTQYLRLGGLHGILSVISFTYSEIALGYFIFFTFMFFLIFFLLNNNSISFSSREDIFSPFKFINFMPQYSWPLWDAVIIIPAE